MMLIEAKQVIFGMLLAGTALVCSGTEDAKSVEIRVKSTELKSNDSRVCDTRTCSKLEYYDKLKQKCRDFPGGGILVIMDHSTKCAHGDSGLHTFSRRDYYYVCHPEGVMIGLCPDSTVFSDTEKRCIMQTNNPPSTIKVHDESQNCNIVVPDCNGVGLFPIPSNCSFYFKCQEHNYDFYQYIYQCPPGKVFHPDLLRCSSSNKCYDGHEDILNNFNKDYFPECYIFGLFRTAKDCSLYYRCVPNMDGSFYQIRYECPYKMYYNIEKESCLPEVFHGCDYIPHERIVEDYKRQHSLEASTLAAYPTTAICAINTRITSSIPAYRDTTQPMDVTGSMSIVQGLNESIHVTDQVTETEGEILTDDPPYTTEHGSGNVYFPTEQTHDPYEECEDTTDSNGGSTSVEEWRNTDAIAMSQQSLVTEESALYAADYEIVRGDTDESAPEENSISILDIVEPTESSQASTGPREELILPSTGPTMRPPGDEIDNGTASDTPRRRFEFNYDEMEWDSGAWVIPNRTKASPAPSKDGNETETLNVPDSTESPDNLLEDFSTTNPYGTSAAGVAWSSGTYTMENGTTENYPTEDLHLTQTDVYSPVSLVENHNEIANSVESTTSSQNENSNFPAAEPNTADPPAAWNSVVEINCSADKDGEIVCNGQKLSVKGYLEILGYTLKLTKWQDAPAKTSAEPAPTIKVHLSLEHPYNYIFEAYATEYRTAFSYDLTTTTPEPIQDNVYEDNVADTYFY